MKSQPQTLIVIGAVPPPAIGPTTAMAKLLSSRILEREFRLHFFDISDHRNLSTMGRLDLINLWLGLKHLCMFALTVIRIRPNLVYIGVSQGFWAYLRDLALILMSILCRSRLVVHLRGSEFDSFHKTLPRFTRYVSSWALRRVSAAIVLGPGLRRVFHGLVDDSRIHVVPNGIDYHNFNSCVLKRARRKSIQRFLFLGNLIERKGLHLAVKALNQARSGHPLIHLGVIGAWGQDARFKAHVMEYINTHNLHSFVTFHGPMSDSDKLHCLAEYDVLVFTPIKPEGLPWVILEGMSCGMPVIATDQGAIVDVVQHGLCGQIVAPSPDAIAMAMTRFIDEPLQAWKMGMAARKRVVEAFSEREYFSRFVHVLQSACAVD